MWLVSAAASPQVAPNVGFMRQLIEAEVSCFSHPSHNVLTVQEAFRGGPCATMSVHRRSYWCDCFHWFVWQVLGYFVRLLSDSVFPDHLPWLLAKCGCYPPFHDMAASLQAVGLEQCVGLLCSLVDLPAPTSETVSDDCARVRDMICLFDLL